MKIIQLVYWLAKHKHKWFYTFYIDLFCYFPIFIHYHCPQVCNFVSPHRIVTICVCVCVMLHCHLWTSFIPFPSRMLRHKTWRLTDCGMLLFTLRKLPSAFLKHTHTHTHTMSLSSSTEENSERPDLTLDLLVYYCD